MDLEHLVEKITREVMDSVKISKQQPSPAQALSASTSATSAVLLIGPSDVDPSLVQEAVSYLRTRNLKVTAAFSSSSSRLSYEGATGIRCQSFSDCAAAVRNAGLVVVLLPDIATISRLANLIADRFDIESVIAALESGREVWGLKTACSYPPALSGKVQGFIKEIENFGIKITELSCPSGVKQAVSAPKSEAALKCPATGGSECSGCNLCASLNAGQVQKIVDKGAERISAGPGISTVPADLAGMIDHTLLKPDATREQVLKLCEEARKYNFASCCVNPTWVATVAECLKGAKAKTCVVIGFPLGANSTVIKAMETRDAVAAGADEVDMVINVGALKAGDYDMVRQDIEAVVGAAQGRIVKVILETALLTDEEKVKACQLAKQAGADFVKTSTGFGPGGATAKDIALMRQTVGKYMGVKASGGIRDFETANEMIKAGATRIGASASVGILKGAAAQPGSGY